MVGGNIGGFECGDDVGDTEVVSGADGADVGVVVGCTEGLRVGDALFVGDIDGDRLGAFVTIGDVDGSFVGVNVGNEAVQCHS